MSIIINQRESCVDYTLSRFQVLCKVDFITTTTDLHLGFMGNGGKFLQVIFKIFLQGYVVLMPLDWIKKGGSGFTANRFVRYCETRMFRKNDLEVRVKIWSSAKSKTAHFVLPAPILVLFTGPNNTQCSLMWAHTTFLPDTLQRKISGRPTQKHSRCSLTEPVWIKQELYGDAALG